MAESTGSESTGSESTGRTVAVIGLGAMGAGLAGRLLASGLEVVVHNRTAAAAEPLAAAGAVVAASVLDAFRQADLVVLSLSDSAAVDEVLAAGAAGLRAGLRIIDTTTVSAEYSRQLSERLAGLGVVRVEACVLGNPEQARAGELRVLAAGPREAVAAVDDVLARLGKEVSYLGPTGNAATTKLVFNLLLGGQVVALAEAVNYGVAAGLDRDRLLSAIGASGFSSRVLSFRAELMRRRQYHPPAFRSRLMAKDLRLGTDAAVSAGVQTPVLLAAARSFDEAVATGSGDADAAVVIDAGR